MMKILNQNSTSFPVVLQCQVGNIEFLVLCEPVTLSRPTRWNCRQPRPLRALVTYTHSVVSTELLPYTAHTHLPPYTLL